MIAVIIAGGSGTRLWPLSTPDYPKHLLKINGQANSLLQHTYRRAKNVADKVYVLTEASHAQHVKDQLPELTEDCFIIEPARRGTASCIIAGLERIYKNQDRDEPVAFMAADHYIRDNEGFAHSFRVAGGVSTQESRIVLIGVEPDHPATGFGYIEKGNILDEERFVFNVSKFKEKPDFSTAKQYFNSGNYLWNCSYFVASANIFIDTMKQYAPELAENFDKLAASDEHNYTDTYLSFENNAIDYALIEKVNNLLVVPASFDWMDLGSYSDLHRAVESDEQGNHVLGEVVETQDVQNSFIQSLDNKPVAVIGLDNVVVINSPDGILVARKDMAQQVGEVSKRINSRKAANEA